MAAFHSPKCQPSCLMTEATASLQHGLAAACTRLVINVYKTFLTLSTISTLNQDTRFVWNRCTVCFRGACQLAKSKNSISMPGIPGSAARTNATMTATPLPNRNTDHRCSLAQALIHRSIFQTYDSEGGFTNWHLLRARNSFYKLCKEPVSSSRSIGS